MEECKRINARLLEDPGIDGGYPQDIFNDLVYRYEEPNGMTRWDSPLFTVLYEDEKPPFEDIWEAMIGSEGKSKLVKPNQATLMVGKTAPGRSLSQFPPTLANANTQIETSGRSRLPVRTWQNHTRSAASHIGLAEGSSG